MKTPNWIIDGMMLDHDHVGSRRLIDALDNAGSNYHIAKYVPFSDEQDYGPENWKSEPTILYGSCGYLSKCKIPFTPGAYGYNSNTNCSMYYSYVPREWMLNSDFIMLPFNVLKIRIPELFKFWNCRELFIRPNSGFKTFAGFVVDINDSEFEMFSTQQLTSVMPDTICLVAPGKKLKAEYRFIIGENDVIDGTQYRFDGVLDHRHDWPIAAENLAIKMAQFEWQPDLVYSCDIAMSEHGPKIIELNSFAACGFYECDRDQIVGHINRIAIREFTGII